MKKKIVIIATDQDGTLLDKQVIEIQKDCTVIICRETGKGNEEVELEIGE